MPKIYHRLYEAAILDCNSAGILNQNNLRAPAIYHCAQAVEKCLKATYAYYLMKIEGLPEREIGKKLSKDYGHNLRKSYEGIMKSLLTLHIESEVKADNKKQELEKLQNMVKPPILDITKCICDFDKLVEGLYKMYRQIINGKFDSSDDEQFRIAAREFLDKSYSRYITVVMNLSAFLTPFEVYSRYPMKELSYNNVTLLNNAKNKLSIDHIYLMITDALNLVVDVWRQIDKFKSKINN
jgi:HEPN domain-containing protein